MFFKRRIIQLLSNILQDADIIDRPFDNDGDQLFSTLSGSSKSLGYIVSEAFGLHKVIGEKNRRHGAQKFNGADFNLTGTIAATGTEVIGSGTSWLTGAAAERLYQGDFIKSTTQNVFREVDEVVSDTELVLNEAFPANFSGHNHKRLQFFAERIDQIELAANGEIGAVRTLRDRRALSQTFRFVRMDRSTEDMSVNVYPDYVPYLRSLFFDIGGLYEFDVLSYTGDGVEVTLQLDTTDEIDAILAARAEDVAVHGSYLNWCCLTLEDPIGSIPAGDHVISLIDAAARTVKIVNGTVGGSTAGVVKFPMARVSADSTKARHLPERNRCYISVGASDSTVSGSRRVSKVHKHKHPDSGHTHGGLPFNGSDVYAPNSGATLALQHSSGSLTGSGSAALGDPVDSSTGGGNPRPSNHGEVRSTVRYFYEYVGRYTP